MHYWLRGNCDNGGVCIGPYCWGIKVEWQFHINQFKRTFIASCTANTRVRITESGMFWGAYITVGVEQANNGNMETDEIKP